MPPTAETLLAHVLLELKELRSEVHQFREELGGTMPLEGWLPPHEAWAALKPDGVQSQQHLKTLRLRGALSETKGDIRNVSISTQPKWEYNIAKSRAALKTYFKRIQAMHGDPCGISKGARN